MKTNLTELAEFFPSNQRKKSAQTVTAIADRFWLPGDTYEQALARQQINFERIKTQLVTSKAVKGDL